MGVAENVCHFNGAINMIMLGIPFFFDKPNRFE